MSDRFLPKDPVSSKEQIVEALYERLMDTRFVLKNSKPKDSFDDGVNYALTYQESWLADLIDIIERS